MNLIIRSIFHCHFDIRRNLTKAQVVPVPSLK